MCKLCELDEGSQVGIDWLMTQIQGEKPFCTSCGARFVTAQAEAKYIGYRVVVPMGFGHVFRVSPTIYCPGCGTPLSAYFQECDLTGPVTKLILMRQR